MRQALVSAIEIATANPTLETLDKIAAALGLNVADLLRAQDGPKRSTIP